MRDERLAGIARPFRGVGWKSMPRAPPRRSVAPLRHDRVDRSRAGPIEISPRFPSFALSSAFLIRHPLSPCSDDDLRSDIRHGSTTHPSPRKPSASTRVARAAVLLNEAFGAAEGGLIFRSGLQAIEQVERNIVSLLPDLSNAG